MVGSFPRGVALAPVAACMPGGAWSNLLFLLGLNMSGSNFCVITFAFLAAEPLSATVWKYVIRNVMGKMWREENPTYEQL